MDHARSAKALQKEAGKGIGKPKNSPALLKISAILFREQCTPLAILLTSSTRLL